MGHAVTSRTSSGVANQFFILLAEGPHSVYGNSPTCAAGNTCGATGSGSLAGIGRDKAAKICCRARPGVLFLCSRPSPNLLNAARRPR